jgi:hypothetical protein
MVPDLGRDELRSLETGVTVEEAVGTPRKFIVLLDDATGAVRLVDGFIYGAFSSRESAMKFVRARGLKLSEPGVSRQPEPPASSADAVANILADPSTPEAARAALATVEERVGSSPVRQARAPASPSPSPIKRANESPGEAREQRNMTALARRGTPV